MRGHSATGFELVFSMIGDGGSGLGRGAEVERILGDSDQTAAETEQTLADADQTSADADQTSADSDQIASDRDQAASDRDLAAGLDPRDHELTREIRQRTAAQRELSAMARLRAARERDAVADARDLAAQARDRAAAARDLMMARRDLAAEQAGGRADFGADIILRASDQRRRAAEYRVLAAEHRMLAAEDRRVAAEDRAQAAKERLRALADREVLAAELAAAETDALTGARTRTAGLTDLDRELDRCRRTGSTFVVAYVDVVGLKRLNDEFGHAAGDDLLRHLAALLRAHLRSYDLIIRLGGDEFLCAIPGMPEAEVRERFNTIGSALANRPDASGIRTGFATLGADESPTQLIARADAELIRSPRPKRSDRFRIASPAVADGV